MALLGEFFLNFFFEVSRPRISNQQPHQQSGGHGITCVIKKANGYKAKNESAISPEPDILVQEIESNDSYNEEGTFHTVVLVTDEILSCDLIC